jgi:transposase-like protein
VTQTVAELDFSEKTLWQRWSELREDFIEDLKPEACRALQRLLETSMDIELQDLIGARRWQHTRLPGRWRNGSYRRGLLTSYGWIPNLHVPRLREGRVRFRCLKAYARRTSEVDAGVLRLFLAGVSTRSMEEVLEPLLGAASLSAATVSKIARALDHLVRQYHDRRLLDRYRYLMLDGIYLKAKSPASVKRRCILVAYGMTADGQRELIDFQLVPQGESQAAWEAILSRLKERGLEGRALAMAIVDGNGGLWNALDLVYPGLARQRCWAHKLRNVANQLPRRLQKPCTSAAHKIYAARSYGRALVAFRHWKKVWWPVAPKAVRCLEADLESLLVFYRQAPKELWKTVRTTNVIERVFREVRRRTRPMSCFQNRASVERIIFALFHKQNDRWKKRPLLKTTQNS